MSRTPGTQLFVAVPGLPEPVALTVDENGLLRDPHGTVWGMRDRANEIDHADVCGVWPLSVPDWAVFRELNDACEPHEFVTSSPEYQWFHTFEEATEVLSTLGKTKWWWWLERPFKRIAGSRVGRWLSWEGRR